MNDKLLFTRIVSGDIDAFTEAYRLYHKLLFTISYKYLMDNEMAKDVVQHVYTKLWESRESLLINMSLKNYLFTMTKNHILNIIRNQNTLIEKQYEIAQNTPISENTILERIEEEENSKHIYEAIDKLPGQKKTICLLKIRESLSNQEIAEKLNLSVNTIKSHYSESLKLLKKHLSDIEIVLIILTLFND